MATTLLATPSTERPSISGPICDRGKRSATGAYLQDHGKAAWHGDESGEPQEEEEVVGVSPISLQLHIQLSRPHVMS
jgi:hypothetical protein